MMTKNKQENNILINLIETIKFARKTKIEKVVFKEEASDLLSLTTENIQLLNMISKEYNACVYFAYPKERIEKHKILDERLLSVHSFAKPQIVITLD